MMLPLHFRRAWLVGGWILVSIALFGSLSSSGVVVHAGVSDKIMHTATYATLSLWFAGIYPRSRYWLIGLGLLAMGVLVEFAQEWMHAGRSRELADIFANALGITLGLVFALIWAGGWALRVEHRLHPEPES